MTLFSSIEFNNEVIFLKLSSFNIFSLLWHVTRTNLSLDKFSTLLSRYFEPDSKSSKGLECHSKNQTGQTVVHVFGNPARSCFECHSKVQNIQRVLNVFKMFKTFERV